MTWEEISNDIARKVYRLEMAEDFMLPVREADARWEQYFHAVEGKTHTYQLEDHILHHVGVTLIVMKNEGMVTFE